jgi:hypothetical protein
MTRVVESIAPDYKETLFWEKVITKEIAGAQRFMELSRILGRPAPVPSIFIDGELVFDLTPRQAELTEILDRIIDGTNH